MNLAVPGFIIGLVGLALAFVVHAVIVARWSARLQTLVEIHSAEITGLRSNGENVRERLSTLEGRVNEHTESGS